LSFGGGAFLFGQKQNIRPFSFQLEASMLAVSPNYDS
jgi:hypothetical protein